MRDIEEIFIIKRALGDELCNYLGYDEMQLDNKISLDLLFNRIVAKLDEQRYKIEDLKERIDELENPGDPDFLYEQSVGK